MPPFSAIAQTIGRSRERPRRSWTSTAAILTSDFTKTGLEIPLRCESENELAPFYERRCSKPNKQTTAEQEAEEQPEHVEAGASFASPIDSPSPMCHAPADERGPFSRSEFDAHPVIAVNQDG
jgi:hypothetical protein